MSIVYLSLITIVVKKFFINKYNRVVSLTAIQSLTEAF